MGEYKVSIGLQNGEMFPVEHNCDLHKCSPGNILCVPKYMYKMIEVVLIAELTKDSFFGKNAFGAWRTSFLRP